MTIYLNDDYICFTENAEGRIAAETECLNDKPKAYIEKCRFVPEGHTWIRADGKEFNGPMYGLATDSNITNAIIEGFDDRDDEVADLINEIEELCNEKIGE